ncbi:MAG: PucR family transcriptional regulator, purine catabolism regulatory protein [Pseudonocardiales bacterium]|nr:PucR family transcriptional regulator, purine catabolism regulatory protein [Pseudonocardiales bacterium]
MLPTLADVLELAAVRRADPHVRAAAHGLGGAVRWVHVSEVADIAHLLEGGELILTTGIALPDDAEALARFVEDLSAAGVTGVAVELGRRYRHALPDELVTAAERTGLPLIELRRETPFVAITQAVHTLILDVRTQELIASDEAHRAFTGLTLAGRGPQQVVDLVASMSGRPVIHENPAHQVLAYSCPAGDAPAVLAAWESRLRAGKDADGDGWVAVEVTTPGGGSWGRLVMRCGPQPTSREQMLLERGATALIINRLTDRDMDSLERQSHRTLLTALALATEPAAETAVRARGLGVPLDGRSLTGVVVRPTGEHTGPGGLPGLLRDLASQAVVAMQALRIPALVGPLDDHRVALLISQERITEADPVLATLSDRLHAVFDRRSDAGALVVGAGSTVLGVERAHSTLREAMQVAEAAVGMPGSRSFFRAPDLRLRGLVHAIRHEPAVVEFVDRELGLLLQHDARRGSHLLDFLAVFCRCGGNKTAAAAELFISRAALYDRIGKVERVLGADLADPDVVLGLHFAVLARETLARPEVAVRRS